MSEEELRAEIDYLMIGGWRTNMLLHTLMKLGIGEGHFGWDYIV